MFRMAENSKPVNTTRIHGRDKAGNMPEQQPGKILCIGMISTAPVQRQRAFLTTRNISRHADSALVDYLVSIALKNCAGALVGITPLICTRPLLNTQLPGSSCQTAGFTSQAVEGNAPVAE